MLYAFFNDQHQPWKCYYTGTYVKADGSSFEVNNFTVTALPPFFQPKNSSYAYGRKWKVTVNELSLAVTIQDKYDNAYDDFWEGLAPFEVDQGGPKPGVVFVEQGIPILENLPLFPEEREINP